MEWNFRARTDLHGLYINDFLLLKEIISVWNGRTSPELHDHWNVSLHSSQKRINAFEAAKLASSVLLGCTFQGGRMSGSSILVAVAYWMFVDAGLKERRKHWFLVGDRPKPLVMWFHFHYDTSPIHCLEELPIWFSTKHLSPGDKSSSSPWCLFRPSDD